MRMIYIFIICAGLILTGCASNTQKKTSSPQKPATVKTKVSHKNPISVKLYSGKSQPEAPYVVLGKHTVSKYNLVGIKRQEAHIRDAMKSHAATLGGDAVINITHDANTVTGTVIAYKAETSPNNTV